MAPFTSIFLDHCIVASSLASRSVLSLAPSSIPEAIPFSQELKAGSVPSIEPPQRKDCGKLTSSPSPDAPSPASSPQDNV
jgi:hypothetical protein